MNEKTEQTRIQKIDLYVELVGEEAILSLAGDVVMENTMSVLSEAHANGQISGEFAKFSVGSLSINKSTDSLPAQFRARRAGWRLFVCDICRSVHILVAQDFLLENLETCTHCNIEMKSRRGWSDDRLPLNEQGQVTLPASIRTLEDFEAYVDPPAGVWVYHRDDDQESLKATTFTGAAEEVLNRLEGEGLEFIVTDADTDEGSPEPETPYATEEEAVRAAWDCGEEHPVLTMIKEDFEIHMAEIGMRQWAGQSDIETEEHKFIAQELQRRYQPKPAPVPGVREDHKTGQFVPTLDGVDTSPTSFSKERAQEIAEEQAGKPRES